jgi:hypothetical protein
VEIHRLGVEPCPDGHQRDPLRDRIGGKNGRRTSDGDAAVVQKKGNNPYGGGVWASGRAYVPGKAEAKSGRVGQDPEGLKAEWTPASPASVPRHLRSRRLRLAALSRRNSVIRAWEVTADSLANALQ